MVGVVNKLRWWILAWVKQVLLRIPFMNRSFVILSSARSGSTYLRLLLDDHPKITCLGELLNRQHLPDDQLCKASSCVLVNYILSSLLPSKFWLPFTGFKVFHEQMEFCNLCFERVLSALLCPKVIVLFRENMLETYSSLQISLKTGIWCTEDGNTKNERIEIDWKEFVEYVAIIRERWKRNLMIIPKNAEIYFVSYEELTADKDKTMNNIFKFLNLEACTVEAKIKKQNPQPLMERIMNYKQIDKLASKNHLDYTILKQWLKTLWIKGKEDACRLN